MNKIGKSVLQSNVLIDHGWWKLNIRKWKQNKEVYIRYKSVINL